MSKNHSLQPARLAGKVAVITGGAEGIGRATAELFIEEGAKIAIGDIQDSLGVALQSAHPDSLIYCHADVAIEGEVESLVSCAASHFGRVDIMFNNAASSGDRSPIADLSAEGFERTLRLVTGSVLAGHKYAVRQFLRQGTGGVIVSTASVAAFQGSWAPAAYTIAKHGVVGIVRAAATELAPLGIRSNAIAPGHIDTPGSAVALGVPHERTSDFLQFMRLRTAHMQPLPRAGEALDVARAALFLASDDSSWITGTVLPVDGGSSAVALGGAAPMGLHGAVPELDAVVSEFFFPD